MFDHCSQVKILSPRPESRGGSRAAPCGCLARADLAHWRVFGRRAGHRVILECRHLSGTPSPVGVGSPIGLSQVRHDHYCPGQRTGALLAVPSRQVSLMWAADLCSLSASRARVRRTVRRGCGAASGTTGRFRRFSCFSPGCSRLPASTLSTCCCRSGSSTRSSSSSLRCSDSLRRPPTAGTSSSSHVFARRPGSSPSSRSMRQTPAPSALVTFAWLYCSALASGGWAFGTCCSGSSPPTSLEPRSESFSSPLNTPARDQPIPYGVFLSIGAAIALFAGPELLRPFQAL